MEYVVLKNQKKALEIELFLSRYGFCKIDLTNTVYMKKSITFKNVKNTSKVIIKIGYCDAQNLLRCATPYAYNSGVYGWNCDFYNMYGGIVISTGYRAIGEPANYELIKEYDDMAKQVFGSDVLAPPSLVPLAIDAPNLSLDDLANDKTA